MTMKNEIPPLPPHWIFDGEPDSPNYTGSLKQRAVLAFHRILSIVTLGGGSLRPLWERCHIENDGVWEEGRDSLRERIQHTNVVVRSFGFNAVEPLSIFRRPVYFSPPSRPSVPPTRQKIPYSFHSRKRDPRAFSSQPLDYPLQVSSSGPRPCWWSEKRIPLGFVM